MNPQSYSKSIVSTGSGPLLQVRLFGGLVLTWDDSALPPIAARSARSLLAYLITYRRRAHTRDLLAGSFWPDLPDDRARRLSQALWQIGRVLNSLPSPVPYLLTKASAVRFNVQAPYWLDTEEFERLVNWETGRLVDWEAVALYRGDFMAGFYDDWAVIERERLREMYLIALSQLLEMCKAREAYEEALRYAQRLATKDPLREEGHREVMRLCHLLGRNNEALQNVNASICPWRCVSSRAADHKTATEQGAKGKGHGNDEEPADNRPVDQSVGVVGLFTPGDADPDTYCFRRGHLLEELPSARGR